MGVKKSIHIMVTVLKWTINIFQTDDFYVQKNL